MTLLKHARSPAIFATMLCLLILTACGKRAEYQSESKGAPANAAASNDGSAVSATASPTTSNAVTGDKVATGPAESQNKKPPATNVPTSQVGTGGNDFFVFTQARAALDADAELKAANIVIEIKGGLLTLNGTVANAEQKSKAEQMVHAVEGVKEVKNQLRISTTSAETSRGGRKSLED